MTRLSWAASVTLALCLHMTAHAAAQQQDAPLDLSSGGSGEAAQTPLASVSCASKPGERTQCPAVTAAGVALLESTGSAACLLGKTWGYDDKGVWVMDGCSGRFALGQIAGGAAAPAPAPAPPSVSRRGASSIPETASWLDVAALGELSISAYALVRYMNQLPADQTFTDHFGNERTIDGRERHLPAPRDGLLQGMARRPEARLQHLCLDRQCHRPGWRLRQYRLPVHQAVQPLRRHQRDPGHALAAGLASVLARPRSRDGRRVLPALLHLRHHGRRARCCRGSGTTPWSATTRAPSASPPPSWTARSRAARRSGGCPRRRSSVPEAGTATGSGTRSWRRDSASPRAQSPEERYTVAATGATGNTLLKLADSLNIFDTGSLAPGVTVQRVDYRLLSFDAGMKYRGIFLQTEIYTRWLDGFEADGPLPVASIVDKGFYVQARVLPGAEEARALRRHVADLRRQGRRLRQQLRVHRRDEFLSHRHAQSPAQFPGAST